MINHCCDCVHFKDESDEYGICYICTLSSRRIRNIDIYNSKPKWCVVNRSNYDSQKQIRRKALSKSQRKEMYDMFDGHCAYCGCEITIDNFNVDHVAPVVDMMFPERDNIKNMMPSCRSCNRRKSNYSLESFRGLIQRDVDNMRKTSLNFKFAERYGLVKEVVKPVVFYFEECNKK